MEFKQNIKQYIKILKIFIEHLMKNVHLLLNIIELLDFCLCIKQK